MARPINRMWDEVGLEVIAHGPIRSNPDTKIECVGLEPQWVSPTQPRKEGWARLGQQLANSYRAMVG